jgi:hypothetical protein
VVARGRWASLACLLVCRRTGLVVFKNCPVVRPDSAVRRVMVRLLRKNGRRREQSSSVCSTGDQRPLSGEPGCRTAGCERSRMPAQVATRLREAQDRSAITVRIDAEKASASLRVQTARLRSGRRDCGAVKLLSTQIVRKQAKAIFISDNAAHCMQRRRQRFPTVRTVSELGNSEVRAKTTFFIHCASTVV